MLGIPTRKGNALLILHAALTCWDIQSGHGNAPAAGGSPSSIAAIVGTLINSGGSFMLACRCRLQVVGGDPDKDVAVLQLDAPPEKLVELKPISVGTSANLQVGQKARALTILPPSHILIKQLKGACTGSIAAHIMHAVCLGTNIHSSVFGVYCGNFQRSMASAACSTGVRHWQPLWPRPHADAGGHRCMAISCADLLQ